MRNRVRAYLAVDSASPRGSRRMHVHLAHDNKDVMQRLKKWLNDSACIVLLLTYGICLILYSEEVKIPKAAWRMSWRLAGKIAS